MFFDFDGVPETTKQRVGALAKRGRLPCAALLSGGSEKTRDKCALELASAVICESPKNGEGCGKCRACLKIKAEAHPDVIHVRPAKDRKTVQIAAVRELVLDSLYVAPNEAKNKVYIFHAADELSPLIQNSLLKTIEEPPGFVMFVFLCDQREKLLSTVISRLTEFSLGDSLSAGRKNKEQELTQIAEGLVKALCREDEFGVLLATAPMVKNRELMRKTAEKIIVFVRDASASIAGQPPETESGAPAMLERSFSLKELLALKDSMEKISEWSKSNANENLLITQFSSMLTMIQKNRK
ncbi:MAG: hypothetical protein IJS90_00145 [Clostridia bacterium]|nr:hypothetical protein [Clostridia bacterium]